MEIKIRSRFYGWLDSTEQEAKDKALGLFKSLASGKHHDIEIMKIVNSYVSGIQFSAEQLREEWEKQKVTSLKTQKD